VAISVALPTQHLSQSSQPAAATKLPYGFTTYKNLAQGLSAAGQALGQVTDIVTLGMTTSDISNTLSQGLQAAGRLYENINAKATDVNAIQSHGTRNTIGQRELNPVTVSISAAGRQALQQSTFTKTPSVTIKASAT
jgi:hypothetical protein